MQDSLPAKRAPLSLEPNRSLKSLQTVFWLLFVAIPAFAQVPETLSYQSFMTNTEGEPVDTTVALTFTLYDKVNGGETLWTEKQDAVPISGGVLSATLGHVESLKDVAFDRPLWLEVTFDENGKTTSNGSRMPLNSVPYAMGMRGLRVTGQNTAPNLIGGYEGNVVETEIQAGTIGGGGGKTFENKILGSATAATIGGGLGNVASGSAATIGGGVRNEASRQSSTVGGGSNNKATGFRSSVGGGGNNEATGNSSFIGAGQDNSASDLYSTVSGGFENVASGEGATVPGGSSNQANGKNSFSAGTRARAEHAGTFVWSDFDIDRDDLVSTAPHQFLIRATNGVGIGTNEPKGALHVKAFSNVVPDLVLGGSNESEADGLIHSDPGLSESAILLHANGDVAVKLDADDNGENNSFTIADGSGTVVFQVGEEGTTSVDALSSAGDVSGSTVRANTAIGTNGTPEAGGVYQDNVVYAWADVQPDGMVSSSFGCSVTKTDVGKYRIESTTSLPNGVSVSVTPKTGENPVISSALADSTQSDITMTVWDGAKFAAGDAGFYVQIVGRP